MDPLWDIGSSVNHPLHQAMMAQLTNSLILLVQGLNRPSRQTNMSFSGATSGVRSASPRARQGCHMRVVGLHHSCTLLGRLPSSETSAPLKCSPRIQKGLFIPVLDLRLPGTRKNNFPRRDSLRGKVKITSSKTRIFTPGVVQVLIRDVGTNDL